MPDTDTGTPTRSPDIHIAFDGLWRGDRHVLAAQELHFAGGRTSCLLGPSGVGKSSLLRLVAGLLDPSDVAKNLSAITSDHQPLDQRVAMMDQREQLLPWFDVIGNVCVGDHLRGVTPDHARATDLLDKVGLADRTKANPDDLSGGMRQRVQLARCLYEQRPVLLMDEPFSRLDAFTRMELQDLTTSLTAGRTIILVTHDMDEAWKMGHDIYVQQSWDKAPEKIVEAPDDQTLPRDVTSPEATAFRQQVMAMLSGKMAQ